MRKHISAIIVMATMAIATAGLAGCGSQSSEKVSDKPSYLELLENNKFYVRHADDTCEEVYFGQGTYESGRTVNTPDRERVLWYQDDYEKIPTLYEGDSLIFYSTDVLTEKFILERYEDYGYTIGLCGLTSTPSGRLSISTKTNDNCTFPNGDTDVILTYQNDTVVLDKLGGQELRYEAPSSITTQEEREEAIKNAPITESGTIKGLKKDLVYEAEVYEGTILHEGLEFTANVHAFGSMEVTETTDFVFEVENNVIRVNIPDFFNSGYYNINGLGMFRYVKGKTYTDDMDFFNVPNVVPEEDENSKTITVQESSYQAVDKKSEQKEEQTVPKKETKKDEKTTSFKVTATGRLNIQISFTLKDGYDAVGDGLPDPSAVITTPSGRTISLEPDGDGLFLSLNATELGEYKITYYDLNVREPKLEIH